jgi:hypothetical protein
MVKINVRLLDQNALHITHIYNKQLNTSSSSYSNVSRTVFLVTIFALIVALTPFFTPLLQQPPRHKKSVPVVDQIVNTLRAYPKNIDMICLFNR